MSPNPVVHEFNKDNTPVGFTFQDVGDHVLSRWLFSNGWDGDAYKLEAPHKHWIAYVNIKGDVIAIVRYKNSQPIDNWVYLKDDLL